MADNAGGFGISSSGFLRHMLLLVGHICFVANSVSTTGPKMTSFACTPSSVDASTTDVQVKCSLELQEDDGHHWSSFGISYSTPSASWMMWSFLEGTDTSRWFIWHFRQGCEPGVWNIDEVTLSESNHNEHVYNSSELDAIGAATSVIVTSARDTTAPRMTSLTCTPPSVDATTTNAQATCSFEIHEDDAHDFSSLTFKYSTPSTSRFTSLHPEGSGTSRWFTWEFEKGCEPGIWKIDEFRISDRNWNENVYNASELDAIGAATSITVTSVHDTIAPRISAMSCCPSTVDVQDEDVQVTCVVTVHEDDVDDFSTVSLLYKSPSRQGAVSTSPSRVRSDAASPRRAFQWKFPKGSELGTWEMYFLRVSDLNWNENSYNVSELGANQITVTAGGSSSPQCPDYTAPELSYFSCSPSSIDISTDDALAECSFSVADGGAGDFSAIWFTYQMPSGSEHSRSVDAELSGAIRTFPWSFPRGSEPGMWTITEVKVTDTSGNEHVYNKGELKFLQILGRPPSEQADLFHMDEVSRMSALGLSVQVNDTNSPIGDDVLNDTNSSRGDDSSRDDDSLSNDTNSSRGDNSSSDDDLLSHAQSLRVASHIAIWSLVFAIICNA